VWSAAIWRMIGTKGANLASPIFLASDLQNPPTPSARRASDQLVTERPDRRHLMHLSAGTVDALGAGAANPSSRRNLCCPPVGESVPQHARRLTKSPVTRQAKYARSRAGSTTRATRHKAIFPPVTPPYPKGGPYGGVAHNPDRCLQRAMLRHSRRSLP